MSDLAVLLALRVQGVAPVDRLAIALGECGQDATLRASALVDAGLAAQRTIGAITGWALTPDGSAALDTAIVAEGLRGDEELADLYERFCVLNERFLKVASDWQVRRHGPIEVPNDHADAEYDQAVIERLAEVHDRVSALLARMCERAPRLSSYRARLATCLERVRSGDRQAFTTALAESYHTAWFELHQDLILTLGVQREA